jgi:photosystem II stability/assembly factor-like uncharacterized protein
VSTDPNHLDAETIAAWADGGLDAASVAAAEAHASNCDRCQALLATVAQTLPAAQPAHGFVIWKWWLAPIAATAAAVAVFLVVPQDPMQPDTIPQAEVAQQTAKAIAEPSAPSAASPPADTRLSESRRNAPAKDVTAEAKVADAQANRADTSSLGDRQDPRETRLERAEGARVAAEPSAALAPAAPVASAKEEVGAVSQLRQQAAPVEFVSPDATQRWRAIAGSIEYSQDGGRTWTAVRRNESDVITGGMSPVPLVCWVIGRAGLVLLTADGTNFTPLPFPERVDLASIAAIDARRATVTTADGRTFQTDDGGQNWRIR